MQTWQQFIDGQQRIEQPYEPPIWAWVRIYRNQRLQESDIMVTRFAEAGLPVSDDWKTYREQLRNITDAFADPDQVVFPDPPPFEIPTDSVSQEERVAALELVTDMLMDEV